MTTRWTIRKPCDRHLFVHNEVINATAKSAVGGTDDITLNEVAA